jgi:Tfp pilus assembly protein PilX
MKSNKEGLKSNAGVALISVLIIVTLLSLLAGTILNLSYMAYSRKLVEKKNNENFYCAEAVLDSVKSVIQNSVAAVVPKAEMSEEDFAKEAFKAITGNSLNVKVGDVVEGNQVKNIQEYLFEKVTRDDSGLKYDGNNYAEAQSTCVENALTSIEDGGNGGSFSIGKIICEEDGVRISDVQIVYVNDEGYTAKIETDILIRAPKYINVSDAPLGSYSMFAGCGAEIYTVGGSGNAKSLGNIMYLHQEGNAYFGSMSGDDSKTSLLIGSRGSNSNKGMTILSIEGTNVICNGDIQIKNGGSLIFTGGDGTETAVIRVNGYIVLNEGSNLFIAPNCKIECKGIVTALEYNSDGSVKKMVPYTGTNPTTQESAETTVSQFYPVTLDYIKSNSSWNSALNDYYDGKIDVEELFYKMGGFSGDVEKTESGNNIYLDDQYENLYSGKYNSGVYVLNETANDDGWTNRTSCKYQLMTCSYVGGEWTWKLNGKSNSQIYCNEDDENLVQDKKVLYDGTYYDAEYFDVVNVPLLNIVLNEQQSINYVFSGYSLEKKNTYSTISWGDLKDKTEYNTWTSGFDWTSLTTSYLDRDFYIPNNATTASMVSPSYDAYKFTTFSRRTTFR